MKTVGYVRVSTDGQDLEQQKLAVYEAAQSRQLTIDDFVGAKASTKKTEHARRLDELIAVLEPGDCVVVSELSRIARSTGQVIATVDRLCRQGVRQVYAKQELDIKPGTQDMTTKVMVTLFGLFAELERDLISMRTKEGLQMARRRGKTLGRPAGKSKLDAAALEIQAMVQMGVKQKCIARRVGCTEATLSGWLKRKREEWSREESPAGVVGSV